jgi:hypothetical protein
LSIQWNFKVDVRYTLAAIADDFGTERSRGDCLRTNPLKANELSVPLVRYFISVGGLLLALLFVVNWVWQNPSPMPNYGSPLDETIVRIRSEHRWPRKVELDAAIPITVPPSTPAADTATTEAAIPPSPKPASNALAQANPPQKQVAKRRPAVRARYRNPNGAGELRFAVNPTPPAWPTGW